MLFTESKFLDKQVLLNKHSKKVQCTLGNNIVDLESESYDFSNFLCKNKVIRHILFGVFMLSAFCQFCLLEGRYKCPGKILNHK